MARANVQGVKRIATRDRASYRVRSLPNTQIAWQDAQQMPDDGLRYAAIGGELVDEEVGEIDLEAVFRRE